MRMEGRERVDDGFCGCRCGDGSNALVLKAATSEQAVLEVIGFLG